MVVEDETAIISYFKSAAILLMALKNAESNGTMNTCFNSTWSCSLKLSFLFSKFQPGGTGSLNGRERSAYNNVNNKVTKFQHIQRKWGGLLSPPPPSPTTMVASPSSPFCGDRLVSETEESDMDNPMGGGGGPPTPKSPHKFAITSGSQTVKSLTNRYEDFMGETKGKYNVTLKCSHLSSPSSDLVSGTNTCIHDRFKQTDKWNLATFQAT